MSKELTPLEWLNYYKKKLQNSGQTIRPNGFDIIETRLKMLGDIDSRSSMRMENIVPHLFEENEELKKRLNEMYELRDRNRNKLKAFEIIKEKKISVSWLMNVCLCSDNGLQLYNEYNQRKPLTQEEFDLLKEVLL